MNGTDTTEAKKDGLQKEETPKEVTTTVLKIDNVNVTFGVKFQ